jgi:hypothetical protein
MGSFEVNPVSSTVVLDPFRRGRATFTVTSRASRTLRAKVRPVALQSSQQEWFKVQGPPERDIVGGVTLQAIVDVEVPATVPFGHYLFRLDVVGIDNPDEDTASSSAVAFDISTKVPPPAQVRAAYWETVSGAAVGAIAIGAVAAVPAAIYALTSGGTATVTGIQTVLLIGALLGSWIGAPLGCWISLRGQAIDGAPQTAMLLAIAYPIVAAPLGFAGMKILGALGVLLAAIVALTVPALAARTIYIRMLHRESQGSRSDQPRGR